MTDLSDFRRIVHDPLERKLRKTQARLDAAEAERDLAREEGVKEWNRAEAAEKRADQATKEARASVPIINRIRRERDAERERAERLERDVGKRLDSWAEYLDELDERDSWPTVPAMRVAIDDVRAVLAEQEKEQG